MAIQRTHTSSSFTNKTFPIVLVCDGIHSPSNIGSLFRIADALGIAEIVFCNATINFKSPRLQKTARSTQKQVVFSESNNIKHTLDALKSKEYSLVALEITDNSMSLEEITFTKNEKIALIIGNEKTGVSNEVLQQANQCVQIEMYGKNSSMNVVQATSIALYAIINKLYIKK